MMNPSWQDYPFVTTMENGLKDMAENCPFQLEKKFKREFLP